MVLGCSVCDVSFRRHVEDGCSRFDYPDSSHPRHDIRGQGVDRFDVAGSLLCRRHRRELLSKTGRVEIHIPPVADGNRRFFLPYGLTI